MRVRAGVRFAVLPEWVLYSSISPRAIQLYAVLQRCADKDDGYACISRKNLAEKLGNPSLDSLDRALKELVGVEAVVIEHRREPGKKEYTVSGYLIRTDPPSEGDAEGSRTDAGTRTDAATGSRKTASEGGRTGADERLENSNQPLREEPFTSPEGDVLCNLLSSLLEANGVKRHHVTLAWRKAADRLLRLDERPYAEAEGLIRWSQADEFWRANIRSMPTFREKYDQLRLQAQRRRRPRGAIEEFDEMWEEAVANGLVPGEGTGEADGGVLSRALANGAEHRGLDRRSAPT